MLQRVDLRTLCLATIETVQLHNSLQQYQKGILLGSLLQADNALK
jgi:hypothetical protein